jgi:predicted chitinase
LPSQSEILRLIMPTLNIERVSSILPYLLATCEEFEINTPLRLSAFIAQIAHESAEFKWMEELWGPTKAQLAYEFSRSLGNTQKGDGFRYRGRGPIQITGRANYTSFGEKLKLPLIDNPNLAARLDVGLRVAGQYWCSHDLNKLADKRQFDAITRKINGGLNGKSSRDVYYKRALHFCSDFFK